MSTCRILLVAFPKQITRVAWVSITANLNQVVDVIFRLPAKYETPVVVSALVLLALVAVSISVLERRVKGVEVVS